MQRTWRIAGAVALALVVGIFLWTRGSDSEQATAPSSAKVEAPAKPRAVRVATDLRAAGVDTLVADDRIGDVRLEGQVVDETMDPVAGALVTLSSNPPRTAETGEDGSFFFDGLVARTYSLVARAEEGAAGPVQAQLSESSEPVILHMRPAAAIEVTVLASKDREPVEGAEVQLRGLMTQTAVADADGVARFRGVASGFYRVAAFAEGFATSQVPLRIRGAGDERHELLLRAGAAVEGIVVDEAGKPVQGARVLFASAGDRHTRADPRFDAQETNEAGIFRFPALATGSVRFSAQHPSYAPGETPVVAIGPGGAESEVRIVLGAGATLAGVVVFADGAPAKHAAVRVAKASRGRRFTRPRQVYTDENGAFEITGLARSLTNVVALHEEATSETLEADLEATPEMRGLELSLGRDGVIAGRVLDSEGRPVDGAQVRLRPDFRDRRVSFAELRLRGFASGVTDPGGNFSFGGLGEGTFTVLASPPGASMRMRGPGPGPGGVVAEVGDTDVEVVIESRGSVSGKLAFADGQVPTAFRVQVGGFRGASTQVSNDDGSFKLEDLEPGNYTLRFDGPEFESSSVADVEVVAGQDRDIGTTEVSAGKTLSGVVVTASGQPVANATVYAGARLRGSGVSSSGGGFRGMGGQTKSTTTDESGAFALRGLGKGALVIAAEHETEGRSQAISLPASAESFRDLNLALLATGALEGHITQNGVPAEAARVRVQSQETTGVSLSVVTGTDGSYRVDVLAPGNYMVYAETGNPRSGISATSETAVITSDAVTSLDIDLATGDVELTIALEGEGVDFATIEVVSGELSAKTTSELEAALAADAHASSGMTLVLGGAPAVKDNLRPGLYSVCATVFPEGVVGPEAMGYRARVGDMAVTCVQHTVAEAPLEQSVSIPVTVPEFVPESGGEGVP